MDCNREEARRAKEIAEGKMQNKDFLGAKKLIQKAQQLYPELENISQMLIVCQVHCSAAVMISGEKDWYSILQVDQSADESSIKRQYRKLALQLHPDKNKFTGAEAAFKLIGEANMILSDRGKRSLYDNKRRPTIATMPRQPPHQTRPYFAKTPGVPANFVNIPTPFGNMQSFWTICPKCRLKFEYLRTFINRSLRCQSCNNNFTAYELPAQAVPVPGANSTQSSNHTQNFMQAHHYKQHVPVQQFHTAKFSNVGFQGNVAGGPATQKSRSNSGINVDCGKEKKDGMAGNNVDKVNIVKGKKKESQKRPVVNAKRKRGKKLVVESSDSCDSDSPSDDSEDMFSEEEIELPAEQPSGTRTGRYPRRSNRGNQNVSYNEEANEEDEDAVTSNKRLRKGGTSSSKVDQNGNFTDDVRNDNDAKCSVGSNTNDSPDLTSYTYPDPEFGNFEEERGESKFAVGQIWAAYDDLDAMPRYYARIKEVFKGEFRLHFNWLEHNAATDTETKWTKAELPVACGNFNRHGRTEYTNIVQKFSHMMSWENGKRRGTYNIYPRKGDVWALYKDWDINWISDVDNHKTFEYEVVEVISDFTGSSDVVVKHLVKIEGSQSLFIPAIDKGTCTIPSTELLRFSHKVPSYRLTGAEKEGILKGSLELDLASLPSGNAFPSISPDNDALKAMKFNDPSILPCTEASVKNTNHRLHPSDAVNGVAPHHDAADTEHQHLESPSNASPVPDAVEYPPNEFHDFEKDKSIEKIKRGQIWALYSDVDQFPKYYAKIKCVSGSTINVSWAEILPQSEAEKRWSERGLTSACGRFKIERKVDPFEIGAFSHLVQAVAAPRDRYDIYPIKGEVWALYKDWSIEWTQSDLETCDYDIAEVLEHTGSVIKLLLLTKVDDHPTVFMPAKNGEVPSTLEVPADETLKFSHRIPAFKITDSESSELKGYWELHVLSLPQKFL